MTNFKGDGASVIRLESARPQQRSNKQQQSNEACITIARLRIHGMLGRGPRGWRCPATNTL
jgi:hypothetical protein